MAKKCAIILAAGEGTRMKMNSPKVLASVLFKPMLKWVLDSVVLSEIDNICIVAGYRHQDVKNYLDSIDINSDLVIQNERKGTAHAVMCAEKFLNQYSDEDVLILGGDSPFIDEITIKKSYDIHKSNLNAATVISAEIDEPSGYGRILRDKTNKFIDIIEHKDATESVKMIKEVNSGAYWFNIKKLLSVLPNISNNNAQGEYYLPDTIKLLLERGEKVYAFKTNCKDIVLGANTCEQLNDLNVIAKNKIIREMLKKGVNIPCADGIIIGPDVKIKEGSCIMPNTLIYGLSSIGPNCIIGPNSEIIDTVLEEGSSVKFSYCKNSVIKKCQSIGPFCSIIND